MHVIAVVIIPLITISGSKVLSPLHETSPSATLSTRFIHNIAILLPANLIFTILYTYNKITQRKELIPRNDLLYQSTRNPKRKYKDKKLRGDLIEAIINKNKIERDKNPEISSTPWNDLSTTKSKISKKPYAIVITEEFIIFLLPREQSSPRISGTAPLIQLPGTPLGDPC